MIQNYPFFANLLELRKEQFERNTAHMNLSKEEKDRRWRVFEQQQAAEMAMAMQAMNGQSNFSAFESTWTTDLTGPLTTPTFNGGSSGAITRTSTPSASNQVRLPLVSNGSYNFFIEWGDGKIDLITRWNQAETTHTYPTAGTYQIKILGGIYGWSFNFSGDSPKIRSIEKWGCLRFVDPNVIAPSTGFFAGCRNLNLRNVQDIPFLKNISSLRGMFKSAWQQGGNGIGSFSINNLNLWDISSIKDLSQMFENLQNFNQYIGDWDTSNVENMSFMFVGFKSQGSSWEGSFYNQDLSKWNTSKVRDMRGMFYAQQNFNQNIGKWDVSNVENFRNFLSTYVTTGTELTSAALRGKFNNGGSDSIKNWNTSKVTDMTSMFRDQPAFNQEVGLWDVSKVTNMDCMFSSGFGFTKAYGVFNNGGSDSIKNWNTSSLVGASMLFYNQRQFNQPIGSWDTSKVTDMYGMFVNESLGQSFNQPLNNWDVSKVVRFGYMFYGNTAFNQPLNNWNPASAADMEGMFWEANNFDQNIGTWNVSNVTKMDNMFRRNTAAAGGFNNGGSDSIKDWNVTNVRRASSMFANRRSFTQPLTNWNIANIGLFPYNGPTPTLVEPTSPGSAFSPTAYTQAQQRGALTNFMQGKTFSDYSTTNYNALLIAWASRSSQPAISANFGTIRYTAAATTARDTVLRGQRGWSIADGNITV